MATRVITAAALLLAILLAIVVTSYGQAMQERRQAELTNLVTVGLTVAGVVDSFARDLETATLATAIALSETNGPLDQQSVGEYLHAISDQYGMLRGLFVTDTSGRVVASASGDGIDLDLSSRPYMQTLMAGEPKVWGPAVAGIQTGEVTVTFGRTVVRNNGELRGYLVAAFYPPRLAERLQASLPADADLTVIDAHGLVLHSTERPDLPFEQRDVSWSPRVGAALRGELVRVDGAVAFLDDQPRFGVVAPVPSTGWAIALTRPLAPVEATLQAQFLGQAAQVAGAVLLVGMLLTMATRRIAQPLSRLAETAGAVARGERPTVVLEAGPAEVGQLATAMQTMGAAVAAREEALRQQSMRMAVLAQASRIFSEAGLDLEDTIATIARGAAELMGDGAAVSLLSPGREALAPMALHNRSPEAATLARELLASRAVRVGESVSGRVAQTGEPALIPEIDQEEIRLALPPEYVGYLDRFGLHSLLAVPLRLHEQTIGVLTLWRDSPGRPYVEEDRLLLEEIANRAAVVIENARLFGEAREQAAALERAVRARDEFLALVTHDLKNPLAAVKGTAQLVRRQLIRGVEPDPTRFGTAFGAIERAVNRATAQIDGLLDIARLQMGQPLELTRRPTDLLALAQETAGQYQETTDSHRIVVEAQEPDVVGEWDAPRLERVLGNLLSNAVKYSPRGGEITVTVGRETTDGVDWAVVAVRDEGLGVPPDALPRIFERFYRGENVAGIGGTGLGLSGVQYVVREHGGMIAVESVEGRGSIFTVRLPLLPTAVAQASK